MGTIVEKLTYLSNAVDDIQAAIIEKGVAVPDTIELAAYGEKIRNIPSGSGNAIIDMFGSRAYSVITISPQTKTYTSL